jgi:hypothetical protein
MDDDGSFPPPFHIPQSRSSMSNVAFPIQRHFYNDFFKNKIGLEF